MVTSAKSHVNRGVNIYQRKLPVKRGVNIYQRKLPVKRGVNIYQRKLHYPSKNGTTNWCLFMVTSAKSHVNRGVNIY